MTSQHTIKAVKIVRTTNENNNAEFYDGYVFHAVRAYYNPLFDEWYFDYKNRRYFIAHNGKLIESEINY